MSGEQHRTVQLAVESSTGFPWTTRPSCFRLFVLASVCLGCLWPFRWEHVLLSLCTSVYISVWHSSWYCILHDFFMSARLVSHSGGRFTSSGMWRFVEVMFPAFRKIVLPSSSWHLCPRRNISLRTSTWAARTKWWRRCGLSKGREAV